jgi:DNA-binding transcriptional ArsR family regulator
MSIQPRGRAELKDRAAIFAALGDATRLSLIGRLSDGTPQSISRLAAGSRLTRQAITKHLKVLEGAGVVQSVRAGRESLFEFRPQALKDAEAYLSRVSDQWEQALGRLKALVEK